MNWEQLKAIVWLRSRLSINQWRKGGTFNFVLMMILAVSMLVLSVLSFFFAIGLGVFLLPRATPSIVMAVWDVMVAVLLFSWSISLLIEIQRMELLSLEKLLHLPMTLRDAFLLNYLSSILCLNIICFVPAALGLCIALAFTNGSQMLLLIPILASFILMLTAVTYQFRGWLSSLMTNKRRQRTVVMFITMGFVALAQVPNLVIQLTLPDQKVSRERAATQRAKESAVAELLTKQEITIEEYDRRIEGLKNDAASEKQAQNAASQAKFERILGNVNAILPVGWLPYASKQLIVGPIWPAFACFAAMTLIGSLSLWRSYKSTLRYYTGNQPSRKRPLSNAQQVADSKRSEAAIAVADSADRKRTLIERTLPWVSEQCSAVAFCSLQNLMRAPEAKMMLLGPVILGALFVVLVISNRTPKIMPGLEPFAWLAGLALLTFVCMMLLMNVFGMDRNGFRSYVLMPVRRSDILLGKNLGNLPIVLATAIFFALILSYFAPVGPLSLLGSVFQMVIAFLLACLAGNWTSIYFPIAMVPGAGKPVQVNFLTMVVQMVVVLGAPLVVAPGCVFVTIEWATKQYFKLTIFPAYAVLSFIEMCLVLSAYRYALSRQGSMLQSRETKILEILTTTAE